MFNTRLRCIAFSFIVSMVFIFGFNALFHGYLLTDVYDKTKDVWRASQTIKSQMHWGLLQLITISLLFSWVIQAAGSKTSRYKSYFHGALIGLRFGLVTGITMFGIYVYIPITMDLALFWIVGEIIKFSTLGVILGYFSQLKNIC